MKNITILVFICCLFWGKPTLAAESCRCGTVSIFCHAQDAARESPLVLIKIDSQKTEGWQVFYHATVISHLLGDTTSQAIRIENGNGGNCTQRFNLNADDTLLVRLTSWHDGGYVIAECTRDYLYVRNDTLVGPIYRNGDRIALNDFLQNLQYCIDTRPNFVIRGSIFAPFASNPAVDLAIQVNGRTQKGGFGLSFSRPMPGDTFSFHLEKTDEHLRGVTSFDLLYLQYYILGRLPINSPYAKLAADVDGSGHISTRDLLLLRAIILGRLASFPKDNWIFIPNGLPYEPDKFPNRDEIPNEFIVPYLGSYPRKFIVVKVGDINGDF